MTIASLVHGQVQSIILHPKYICLNLKGPFVSLLLYSLHVWTLLLNNWKQSETLHDVYTLFLCCFRSQMWYIVHPLQKYHTLQEPLIFSTHSEVMLSLCKSLFLQASLLLWPCIKFCCLLDWQMTICMCIMSIAICPVSHVTNLPLLLPQLTTWIWKSLVSLNLTDWLVRSQGLVSSSLLWSHITLDYHHMECVVVCWPWVSGVVIFGTVIAERLCMQCGNLWSSNMCTCLPPCMYSHWPSLLP